MMRRIVGVVAAVAVLGMAGAGRANAGLHAGDVAPNFRGTDLTGVSRHQSDYLGKVVVLFVLAYF